MGDRIPPPCARPAGSLRTPDGQLPLAFILGARRPIRECLPVPLLLFLAPLFVVFELWQLVLSERYVGIKQIERNGDPRTLGLHELTAFGWSMTILLYWTWMLGLLFLSFGRVHGLSLLLVSGIGYALRRNCGLKWVLVILTFEGALRVGLLLSLCVYVWRRY
jgi:hypothetical protein